MDNKLMTSKLLLRKLAFGCGDAQFEAVAEIRLFAKWDDANRVCLGRAGAIAPLIKLLDQGVEARVQENAVLALLNMSINPENKVRMVREEGSLDTVMQLVNEGASTELKANAAALLYSLVVDDEARRIVGTNEKLWSTVLAMLRDGSAKSKAEALKALFVAAGDDQTREMLLNENLQTISLLFSMVTVGKVRLAEDCLAVLALLASSGEGAAAITRVTTSIPVLAYLVNSGSSAMVQENAMSVLIKICQNDKEAQNLVPLQAIIPAVSDLHCRGSERGKAKAEVLLRLLGFDEPASIPTGPNSDFSHIPKHRTMPCLAPHTDASALQKSTPVAKPPSSSHSSSFNASWSNPFCSIKYVNLAKKLFTHKPKKKSHSPIT